MNSRNALIALVCLVLVCVGGGAVWKMSRTREPAEPDAPQPVQPATQVTPEPAARASVAPRPMDDPEPEPAVPTEEPPAEPPAEPATLTAESLAGTKWEQGPVNMKFLPDGRWEMNGRICAKWEVEGNRIRIFDDNGEEHFVDIEGDTLTFNGQEIARVED